MNRSNGVSVALAVARADPALFATAVECVRRQSLTELDIMLILNGSDAETARTARELAAADGRIRVLELPRANLAAALNLGLREARHELVARMDADDECDPERFAKQCEVMRRRPSLAAVGTCYERIGPAGGSLGVVRLATEAREIRWRLLVENTFCHGSMMLRRGPVLEAGGYDPACERAQDYELWLRLSRRHELANLPDVLYRHRARADRADGPSAAQADVAARAILKAWRDLPTAEEGSLPALELAIAAAHRGDARAADLASEVLNGCGPSREALLAWLLSQTGAAGAAAGAMETCRRSRLREVGSRLSSAGVESLWLWGAGRHTEWLLSRGGDLGLRIAGLVDDRCHGERRLGYEVMPPESMTPGAHVLLSSDWHEEAMWRSSEAHRARGVRVWRLYADQDAASV